jgi:hypothetical protein
MSFIEPLQVGPNARIGPVLRQRLQARGQVRFGVSPTTTASPDELAQISSSVVEGLTAAILT